MFQVYDRKTGKFRRSVSIDYEMLTVRFEDPIWIAGRPTPFSMNYQAPAREGRPNLRVYLRPLGTAKFHELQVKDGKIVPPKSWTGLYHLRVTAGLEGAESEYQVETAIEIRPANARGSISIFTRRNRRHFAAGELIPFQVLCRTRKNEPLPKGIEIRLVDETGKRHLSIPIRARLENGKPVPAELTSQQTKELKRGAYRLSIRVPGWTIAEQHLFVGTPKRKDAYKLVRHGDYYSAYPKVTFWNAPEKIRSHVAFSRAVGLNMFVDRLGHSGSGHLHEIDQRLENHDLVSRLQKDPRAVAPEKAVFDNRVLQTAATYGVNGIEQRGILLYMDAGLPVGTGFDKRSPRQMQKDIIKVTKQFDGYPAFRGWSWAANWWIDKRGERAAKDDNEKRAYKAAFKAAQEKGRWDPILETVSDRWINHAVKAERLFRTAMKKARSGSDAKSLKSAMTAPYRQPGMIPPLTFANADEVDLQFQAEQIQWPMISAHNVDFYKRPGKPAWGHPELWNDDGTGAQILSNLLQMLMRGADGVGQSGRTRGFGAFPPDPRSMGAGATSVHRTLYTWVGKHGPWLSKFDSHDPIVIPVSTRMMRLELGWKGVGGFYFTRLFEAYNACLRAHRPAQFIFAEDCAPDAFTKFQGVLIVSQTVEFDPQLAKALQRAKAAKVPIFADKSCRSELVKDYRRLDIAYTNVERDPHVLNDDSAFWRYRQYMQDHVSVLKKTFGSAVPVVAKCDNSEVLLTERRHKDVRVLFAVNDAHIPLGPGHLWRVGLAAGSRMPVVTSVRWNLPKNYAVVELFSGRKVDPSTALPLDLRTAPGRIFVAAPKDSPTLRKLKPRPTNEIFGARLRDLAVSPKGDTALVTAADWNRNLYAVDLKDGKLVSQAKAGHHFAYAPVATTRGFAVQGYDLTTAEGYHLYLTDGRLREDNDTSSPPTTLARRFALYGLPNRGVSWANSKTWQDPINNFAISPDGEWVASSGDLGLVVWSRQGRKLWSQDWWKDKRQRVRLVALDSRRLLTLNGFVATAYDAKSGRQLWHRELGKTGVLVGGVVSTDGKTVALKSTAEGGQLFVLRNGNVTTLSTSCDDSVLSPDGRFVAVVSERRLKVFDSTDGLLWSFTGDDILQHPRFSRKGDRIVVGSELGTLYVLAATGDVLLVKDMKALPRAEWLPGGDLLVATWMGHLQRLDGKYQTKWITRMQPDSVVTPEDLLARDKTPTTRVSNWGNAAAKSAALKPNLLGETPTLIEARCVPKTHGDPRPWHNKIDLLTDGEATPPSEPWLHWTDINYIDSGWRQKLVIQVDTFRTQFRLRGITMVEDPNHPESWLRDVRLQWWDASAATWKDGAYLLSNQATHTHWFQKPIEAAKFRFVSTGGGSWPVGNLRLGELVFHGENLGCSHPDVLANRPVAVLFDEKESDLKQMMAYGNHPFAFSYDDAYSGGKSVVLTKAGHTDPHWRPPFGHELPNWDFKIVENPKKPGEYRWLQFAWKSLSPKTTGITLRVGDRQTVTLNAGDATKLSGGKIVQYSKKVPAKWQIVRVDLWKLTGKEFRIRRLTLAARGGGAAFDQILLGRGENDITKFQKGTPKSKR